jgi:hypothetical protein
MERCVQWAAGSFQRKINANDQAGEIGEMTSAVAQAGLW